MRIAFIVVVVLLLGFGAYVRLAPSDPAVWHVDPPVTGDETHRNAAKRLIENGAAQMAALHKVVLETPRTRVLAGDLESGHVTYVTRSALWGFPDYTTVKRSDGDLLIWGRARFGASDMGVNAARIDGWLRAVSAR